jgi:hypothetical protein
LHDDKGFGFARAFTINLLRANETVQQEAVVAPPSAVFRAVLVACVTVAEHVGAAGWGSEGTVKVT